MKKIKIGNILIWLNWFALFTLLVRLGILTSYYMEYTKTYKTCLIVFILIAVIQSMLCSMKYDK